MGEAFSSLAAKGTVVSQGFPRLDLGSNSVYGLVLIVDEKRGDHATSGVFFNKGKLYLVQAIAPQNGQARFDSGIGRFIETVRFHLQGYGFDEKIGHIVADENVLVRNFDSLLLSYLKAIQTQLNGKRILIDFFQESSAQRIAYPVNRANDPFCDLIEK